MPRSKNGPIFKTEFIRCAHVKRPAPIQLRLRPHHNTVRIEQKQVCRRDFRSQGTVNDRCLPTRNPSHNIFNLHGSLKASTATGWHVECLKAMEQISPLDLPHFSRNHIIGAGQFHRLSKTAISVDLRRTHDRNPMPPKTGDNHKPEPMSHT